ncbi:replication protein [Silvimonas soli]|uniref:replication protein n=1 Tax=Silvimonas soli TaxID=2980100 RepID=UPI0024B34282|nr:replication protein [Silvimonas soli]
MQDGFVAIPNDVYDALLCSPISQRQERVYLAILRKTAGYGKDTDCLATNQISAMTGIADSHVRAALTQLEALGMLIRGRRTVQGVFLTPVIDPSQWKYERTDSVRTEVRTDQIGTSKRTESVTHNRQLQQKEEQNPFTATTPESPEAKPKQKRANQLPADFAPSESHSALALELGVNLLAEFPGFVDYHRAKGSTMKDWNSALNTWLRNAKKFGRTSAAPSAKSTAFQAREDNRRAAARSIFGNAMQQGGANNEHAIDAEFTRI